MSKLIDKDDLAKVAQALNEINQRSIQKEKDRAMDIESKLQGEINNKTSNGHAHNDLYYTKSNIDTKLKDKSSNGHKHNDLYYTKTEIDGSVTTLNTAINQVGNDCKQYTDDKITDLIDSAPEAMDTLNELAKSIKAHKDDYTAYVTTVSTSLSNVKSEAERYAVNKDNELKADLQDEIANKIKKETDRANGVETSLQSAINGKSDSGHLHEGIYCRESDVVDLINGVKGSGHNHNNMYYTESEIDAKFTTAQKTTDSTFASLRGNITTLATAVQNKSDSGHKHNDLYYTKTEIDGSITTINTALDTKASDNHGYHIPTPQTANNATFLRNDNTWKKISYSDIGAAQANHGTHVVYSTTVPKAPGTATVGSESGVSRGDHVHPAPTNISGNAGTATKLKTAVNIQIGNRGKTFNGSESVSWTLAEIGALPTAGGTMTNNINYQFSGASGHAIGLSWKNSNATVFGGIGGLANAGTGSSLYMGWGDSPWLDANNFKVNSTNLYYKGKTVYHEGNKPTPAAIGAAPASKSVVTKNASSNVITLSKDQYQVASGLTNGGTINLPNVSGTTIVEINLFVNNVSLSSLKLPDNCVWRVDPNLEVGKYFMFTFLWNGTIWLAEAKIYS